jgi:hypothetical protein
LADVIIHLLATTKYKRMPTTPTQPSPGPSTVTFNSVPLGSTATSFGAHLPQTNGSLFARIEGDTNGVFSVQSLETDALVHDPDLPPGFGKVWEPVQVVNGAGPISVTKAEALLVTVCSPSPAH